MKARIPLSKDVRKLAKEVALQEVEKQQKGATRRLIKLTMITLRKTYGFGFKRLLRYERELYKLIEKSANDEIFWYHNDKALDQLGFKFEHEDYEEWDR